MLKASNSWSQCFTLQNPHYKLVPYFMHLRILALIISVSLSLTFLDAQSNLAEGYEMMANNKIIEAKAFFTDKLEREENGEAAMALSFVEANLGNTVGAIDAFSQFYELEKNEQKRNVYLDAVWSSTGIELSKGQLKMEEELLESNYTRLRPLSLYGLGNHYSLINQPDKAQEYFARLGMTEQWQITGSFENISESGFDKDFGVIANPQPDATFLNKNGISVGWFPVNYLSENRWLNFSNHLETYNAILYAQTFVTSKEDRDIIVRLGTSGSVKVWVNDALVFVESEERDNHLDTYVFSAELKTGNNRILVQNGATDKTSANFMLRLTDATGNVLKDLAYSTIYSPYPKGNTTEIEVIPNPTVEYLEGLIEEGDARFLDYTALSQYYLLNGFYPEARRVMLANLDENPSNIEVMGDLSAVLEALDDKTGASSLKQYILENAPNSIIAFVGKLEDAESSEDWTTYEKLLMEYIALYGYSEFTLGHEVNLMANRKEMESLIRLVEKGVKDFPESSDFILVKSQVLSDLRKNPKGAIKLLEDYGKKHHRSQVVEQLISLHFNAGNVEKVEGLIYGLLKRNPLGVNYYSRLAKLYQIRGKGKKSQLMLDEAVKIAPYSGSFYRSMGEIFRDGEEPNKAKEAFRKAISLNPYDYDSRDALRSLTSEDATAFSSLSDTDYYANFAASPGADAFPNDNSLVVNYNVDQIIHPGGASEKRTTVLIKILKPEGVEAWKEYTIGLYGKQQGFVDAVEVFSPDGSRHEASRSGTDIVFDGLEAGGGIYLTYRLKDFQYGQLSGKFAVDHPMNLSYPVLASRLRLFTPKGLNFTTKTTGPELAAITKTQTELNSGDLYTWESKNTPAIEGENSMPSFSDVMTSVRITNIDNWAFIANWYSELTHAKVQPDDYVEQEVAELFAKKGSLTKREEVELIYDYVVSNIRYISVPFLQSNFIPQRSSKTLTTGQGDCKDVSSLFVAMCEVRGIDANLVLVSTRDQARSELALPGTGFNHCIAKVNLEEKDYFVELTDENLPFGTGDWSVNNSFAIVIPRKGETFNGEVGLINPPTRGVNTIRRTGTVSFLGDDMVLSLKNHREGSMSSSMRHSYEQDSKENQEKTMLSSLSSNYPNIKLMKLAFTDGLDDLSSAVDYEYTYQASDVVTNIGGMQLYEISLSDRLENPNWLSTESRELPLDLWNLFNAELYEQTFTITPPEGKSIVEVPNSITVENDYLSYKMEYKEQEGELVLYRYMRLKNDRVPPTAYPTFREDALKIVAADKVTLAFR
jgi:tetratricopeptide (TPR) repeat protein